MMLRALPLHNGMRLDQALAELITDQSRSSLQKWIRHGLVLVDGQTGKKNMRLKGGEAIRILEIPQQCAKKKVFSLSIIHEDNEVIVIDKPCGLVVHPSTHHKEGTLVDLLIQHYPLIKKVGDDPIRPGIVHRLDKDASGVMVIAKTQDSFDSLRRQFKLHTIDKEYRALVYGIPSPTDGIITLSLGRRNSSPKIIASYGIGKSAETHYWVEKKYVSSSLVKVCTISGRTHQIRAHFTALGHPLVGDAVYTSKKIRPISCPRLMLHAYLISFNDLNGRRATYAVPLPKDFEMVLSSL